VVDTCLKFDDGQWGSWNAPNCEALEDSDFKALEADKFKEINVPIHCDPEFLYSDDQTLSTVSSYSSTETAGNAFPEEFIDVFQVLIENDDKTQTREDMYAEISEISYMIPTPKNGKPRDLNLTPISIMVIDTIGAVTSRKLLKVLFDPGSTKTMISRKALPKGITPLKLGNTMNVSTLAGTMKTNEMVKLRNLKLPEFDKN
jgi:hypothetical protein